MKEILAQGHRGLILLEEVNGEKILTKKAKNKSKKGAIKKEIQILEKLNKSDIDFVPNVLDVGEDFFKYKYIDGTHFKKEFEKSNYKRKLKLVDKLIKRAYKLDKVGVYHGEFSKPHKNMLVDQNDNVYVIDFERGGFVYGNESNLKDLAQFLHRVGFISYKTLRKIGHLDISDMYKYISFEITKRKIWYYLKYLLFLGGLVFLDLITKYLFYDLGVGQSFVLISKVLNDGITWGIQVSYFLPFMAFGLVSIFGLYLVHQKHLNKYLFILLLAGGVGNIFDRLVFGGVRDFINLQYWPVFNFADVYLTLFVFGVILNELKVFLKD